MMLCFQLQTGRPTLVSYKRKLLEKVPPVEIQVNLSALWLAPARTTAGRLTPQGNAILKAELKLGTLKEVEERLTSGFVWWYTWRQGLP